LTVALETDPGTMRHLGGPASLESAREAHVRRLKVEDPDWWLKIVPDPGGPAAGTIGIWDSEWEGARVHEAGWMVLPEFRGRGIATQALALLLERARSEPRIESVHAFPNVENEASNTLCRRAGFELIGNAEVEFRGHRLRCNHWVVEV
jgi:RimJ/RimL family protein N-acetyltransferase